MSLPGLLQGALFCLTILVLTPPLGAFLHAVFEDQPHALRRPLRWLERLVYRLCGVQGDEQTWPAYARSLLVFSALTLLGTYALLRLQGVLPGNPQGRGGMAPLSAFNVAVSFTTNTNWQAYAGESTLGYLAQMAGLAWHNFLSAAAGLAVALAFVRGLTRAGAGTRSGTLGNFWVDTTRALVYVLLPLCLICALFFVSQGVIQNFAPYREALTLEGRTQLLALGPVASQEAIKQLGTNGGGFFNANAAHPFENPTPLSNFVGMLLIFLLPAALTRVFGRMAGDVRQGWALFGAMSALFLAGAGAAYWAESETPPALTRLADVAGSGNLEGKETRFGVAASALYATATTAASCGSVNAMHDSFTPLGGLVTLFNMQLGEVVFGGVGAGLYGMLMMALLAVFIAGLMVGRTPEYLGKKIEVREVRLAMLYTLVFPLAILALTAWSSVAPYALAARGNLGPHGLSELLYAFTSAVANNGSAFAGLAADTPWYNAALGYAMLVGRFFMILPVLAVAGLLAGKRRIAPGPGTLPTGGLLFALLLLGVVVIVGALTFLPALGLGPLAEHYAMRAGKVF